MTVICPFAVWRPVPPSPTEVLLSLFEPSWPIEDAQPSVTAVAQKAANDASRVIVVNDEQALRFPLADSTETALTYRHSFELVKGEVVSLEERPSAMVPSSASCPPRRDGNLVVGVVAGPSLRLATTARPLEAILRRSTLREVFAGEDAFASRTDLRPRFHDNLRGPFVGTVPTPSASSVWTSPITVERSQPEGASTLRTRFGFNGGRHTCHYRPQESPPKGVS